MSFGVAIGDFVAVANIAWQLHQNCYKVIKDCPHEFKELVRDLSSVYGVMKRVEEDYCYENSTVKARGERGDELVQGMLKNVQVTLENLQKLIHKYQGIATKRGWRATKETFWTKVKWISDRTTINKMRQDLTFHITTFNLLLTSIGNSSLFRLEQSLSQLHLCSNSVQDSFDNPSDEPDAAEMSQGSIISKQTLVSEGEIDDADSSSHIAPTNETLLTAKFKIVSWEELTDYEKGALARSVVFHCQLACFDFYEKNSLWRCPFSENDSPTLPRLFDEGAELNCGRISA